MKTDDSDAIRKKLLNEMKNGIFAECDRLPRENVLAQMLGISRTHLRDILPELEREGFITRRHGVGTVINRHVLKTVNRMDIFVEFLDIIRQNGYEPDVVFSEVYEEPAQQAVADKLQIPAGTTVLRICRLCTADGRPAIFCEDILEKSLVKHEYTMEDLKSPIYDFLPRFCEVIPFMDLTDIHARTADSRLAKVLEVAEQTPLLNLEEVDYDIEGKAIFYSREYFVDSLFLHTVLRKKL